MPSRRRFLALGAAAPLAALPASDYDAVTRKCNATVPLNGPWEFRFEGRPEWRIVDVPHTWQVEPGNEDYRGVAWYRRVLDVPADWSASALRVEFEAVFHSAVVSLNGVEVGRHIGKGYTAFTCDLTPHVRFGAANTLLVRVDNSFNESMLPRGRSSDWAHDGGIYRPVNLLVTPRVFIERVAIDAEPRGTGASVQVAATVRNTSPAMWQGTIVCHVEAGFAITAAVRLEAGARRTIALPPHAIESATLWHFDHPHLYTLTTELSNGDALETNFGVRKIEIRDRAFYLNGERVRLMGVERMAGSNPEYGMAEPASWIAHDHADMKELNCVYTRVHWQQDRRVLDWCDRHGILIQTEVPTWGADTFKGMAEQPSADIMRNGLEQLREMIERDRNHPCVFSWGVCNEIGGQHPPAYAFAKRMYEEAKRLDPKRLVTYASNSLQKTPEKDVAGLMDYVMWNEYYESWYGGTPADLARNLDEIHRAFPDKPIVISEYGYCACTADRPEGDARRLDVLETHDRIFRERPYVAGLIFFDYNDYRTHIGDRGSGVMKQRVHGVVDLYGTRKPSWETLRKESSPLESVSIGGQPAALNVALVARGTVPAYPLRGYQVRGIAYGLGDIPIERASAMLETLMPGTLARTTLNFSDKAISRIQVDVLRPTGFSVWTGLWRY